MHKYYPNFLSRKWFIAVTLPLIFTACSDTSNDRNEDVADATNPDATNPDTTSSDATNPDATSPDATNPDANISPSCADITCSNHGTCQNNEGSLSCECDAGYHAENLSCIVDGETGSCNGITCSGHGTCTISEDQAQCLCDVDFTAQGTECVRDSQPDPCADVQCSDHKSCIVEDESAVCQCEPGWWADGLSCVRDCQTWQSGQTIDIPTVTVSGAVTFNGQPTAYRGKLVFKSERFGQLDQNTAQTGEFDATIIPGTYDIYYSSDSGLNGGYDTNAQNQNALIRDDIRITADTTLNLDIDTTTVDGAVTFNGQPAAHSVRLSVVSEELGTLTGSTTQTGEFDATIIPGTYDIYYSSGAGLNDDDGTNAQNQNALLRRDVQISADTTLSLDIDTATVDGAVTFNGQPTAYRGKLVFKNDQFGQLDQYTAQTGEFDATIIPSTYDIYYSSDTDPNGSYASNAQNQNALLRRDVQISADTTLNLDIDTATVIGAVTFNGQPAAYSLNLSVVSEDLGTLAGNTLNTGEFQVTIIPGTYDVYYSGNGGYDTNAQNQHALIRRDVQITDDTTLNLDVDTATVAGVVTFNDQPASGEVNIQLVNDELGTLSENSSQTGDFDTRLIPGSYDVYYSSFSGGYDTNAQNQNALIRRDVQITDDTTLNLDVDTATVAGALTFNGQPAAGNVNVKLVSDELGTLSGNTTGTGEFNTPIIPGTYDVYYSSLDSGYGTNARNQDAWLTCVEIQ